MSADHSIATSDGYAPIGPSGILSLGFVYAAIGIACLKLAVPPGYTVPMFIPAGIALASAMVFGQRALLATLIGSLLIQIEGGLNLGLSGSQWWGSLTVPPAAAAQAALGAWLARRWRCYPGPCDTPALVLRLLLGVVPLTSLLTASIAVPALLWSGSLPQAEGLFNWWAWWLGDTIGAMIATPVMLVFFAQPRSDWIGRRLAVALPMALACVLLLLAILQINQWERQRIQRTLERDAETLAHLVEKRFSHQLDMVVALERLLLMFPQLTRSQYAHFVAPWLERYSGLQNFGLSRWVEEQDRAAFEANVSATDWPGFQILGRDANGQIFPAPQAPYYLPIVYVEPLAQNLAVVGLDPLVLPETRAAIERSRVSGLPSTSLAFRLVQERGRQRGVVVYQLVQRSLLDGQPNKPIGLISAVFRLDDLIDAALAGQARSDIELCLIDNAAPPDKRRLSGAEGCEHENWLAHRVSWQGAMRFTDRDWRFHIRATPAYLAMQRSWAAWTTLAVGLSAVAMLGIFLLVSSGRTRRIEIQVKERTQLLEEASQRLHEQRQALDQAQRIARLGSFETRLPSGITQYSDGLLSLLGLPSNTGSLRALLDLLQPDDAQRLEQALSALQPGSSVALDCRIGERILALLVEGEWADDNAPASSPAAAPQRLRGIVQDVTEARNTAAHVHYLAHFDALTDLPNRHAWLERTRSALASARRSNQPMAVLFLDIDHFKTVNDSLGHAAGDRLLHTVAQRLQRSLREDDCIARLGGDEFVVLLPQLGRPEDAAMVARKLLAALATPVDVGTVEITVSASIGIAVYPPDGEDVDTLLKHADTAMYGAKEAGRNQYQFFVAEMNQRALERLTLENALRRAIERGELSLHYQPQVDVHSGRICGCEALLRWRHPELGMISPLQFIPIAEKSGLILPIGDWVLEQALQQQRHWQDAGLALSIAINISALQFGHAEFDQRVATLLQRTGADPRLIELEITESTLMQPTPALLARLERLRKLGLTLALDDFGTGYSSLTSLKRLPIGRLKLDRSFVADLPGDPEDAAITTAALSLAQGLGMDTVGEGVETAEQLAFLRQHGCTTIQGYYFSRPLPADECLAWIRAHATGT